MKEIGEKFEVRQFHHHLLGNAALALNIVETRIKEWVVIKKKSRVDATLIYSSLIATRESFPEGRPVWTARRGILPSNTASLTEVGFHGKGWPKTAGLAWITS